MPARCGADRGQRGSVDQGLAVDLYPAIDLRGGRVVRLRQGDFAAETVYDSDPVGVACRFASEGASFLHVVDLDAARTGDPTNRDLVAAICRAVECPVQVGGGVRTRAAARALMDLGAARVVLGTAAIEQPGLVADLCRADPERVAVGLDARGRDVAVRGWVEGGAGDLVELAGRFADAGVAALVVTEIGRDGMLSGPDVEQLAAVLAATDVPIVASGGVGSLDDLRRLADLAVGDRRLAGAIVGRALYDGRFGVAEALVAIGRSRR